MKNYIIWAALSIGLASLCHSSVQAQSTADITPLTDAVMAADQAGDFARAIEVQNRVITQRRVARDASPNDPRLHHSHARSISGLARLQFDAGQYDAAINSLQKSMALREAIRERFRPPINIAGHRMIDYQARRSDHQALTAYALALYPRGSADSRITRVLKRLDVSPDDIYFNDFMAHIHFALARDAEDANDTSTAKQHYQLCQSYAPSSSTQLGSGVFMRIDCAANQEYLALMP